MPFIIKWILLLFRYFWKLIEKKPCPCFKRTSQFGNNILPLSVMLFFFFLSSSYSSILHMVLYILIPLPFFLFCRGLHKDKFWVLLLFLLCIHLYLDGTSLAHLSMVIFPFTFLVLYLEIIEFVIGVVAILTFAWSWVIYCQWYDSAWKLPACWFIEIPIFCI